MEKIRLGRTNLIVSRVGFGGIPIQRLSEEAVDVVRKCLDLDINFIDTANAYTNSEERIGKAIVGRREGLILATKSTSRNPDELKGHLQQSLRQLGVDYIDLYQFHGVNDSATLATILQPNGPMSVVQEAKEAGLVKHIGITSHQVDTAKEAVRSGHFETIMFPFNFIASEPAEELLEVTKEHDVGYIAMKPLGGGMLDNVSLAFKYLLQFSDVMPVVGIEKAPQMEEIVNVLQGSWQMTEAEIREIGRHKEELGTSFCRRCDYCQPCTAGIPISDVMIMPSLLKRLIPQRLFTGGVAEAVEKATHCTDCGDCEERCPYKLPIRQMIAEHIKLWQAAFEKHKEQATLK